MVMRHSRDTRDTSATTAEYKPTVTYSSISLPLTRIRTVIASDITPIAPRTILIFLLGGVITNLFIQKSAGIESVSMLDTGYLFMDGMPGFVRA